MSSLDEIAQKRADIRSLKQADSERQQNIDAITGSGQNMVEATSSLATTRDVAALSTEIRLYTESVSSHLNEIANLLRTSPDMSKLWGDLSTKIDQSLKELDSSEADNHILTSLEAIQGYLATLSKVEIASPLDYTKSFNAVTKAISNIQVNPTVTIPEPVVNVAAPVVNVKEPKLDLKPLQASIDKFMNKPVEPEKFSLEAYMAQDIIDSGNLQYIGFLKPDGGWYIIENDIKGNSLRYVFGHTGYQEAFSQAASYEYMLLNEAIDAL
jgi:hypothetical protein